MELEHLLFFLFGVVITFGAAWAYVAQQRPRYALRIRRTAHDHFSVSMGLDVSTPNAVCWEWIAVGPDRFETLHDAYLFAKTYFPRARLVEYSDPKQSTIHRGPDGAPNVPVPPNWDPDSKTFPVRQADGTYAHRVHPVRPGDYCDESGTNVPKLSAKPPPERAIPVWRIKLADSSFKTITVPEAPDGDAGFDEWRRFVLQMKAHLHTLLETIDPDKFPPGTGSPPITPVFTDGAEHGDSRGAGEGVEHPEGIGDPVGGERWKVQAPDGRVYNAPPRVVGPSARKGS